MHKKEISKLEKDEAALINFAVKAALRDGYDQIVYYDTYGDLAYGRDYNGKELWKTDTVVGHVTHYWENGISKASFAYADSMTDELRMTLSGAKEDSGIVFTDDKNPNITYDFEVYKGINENIVDVWVKHKGKTIGEAHGIPVSELKLDDNLGGNFLSESNGFKSIRLTIHKELPELARKYPDKYRESLAH